MGHFCSGRSILSRPARFSELEACQQSERHHRCPAVRQANTPVQVSESRAKVISRETAHTCTELRHGVSPNSIVFETLSHPQMIFVQALKHALSSMHAIIQVYHHEINLLPPTPLAARVWA